MINVTLDCRIELPKIDEGIALEIQDTMSVDLKKISKRLSQKVNKLLKKKSLRLKIVK